MAEQIGKIEEDEIYEEKQICWKIPDFPRMINTLKMFYDKPNTILRNFFHSFKSPNFSFSDYLWHFCVRPKRTLNPGAVIFSVSKAEYSNGIYQKYSGDDIVHSVEYNYGVKKLDGSVEIFGKGKLKGSESLSDNSLELSDLLQRMTELAPFDVLTIICTMKRGTPHSIEPSVLETPKTKKLIKLDTLSENFKDLFANKESCDTIMLVKNTEYRAHKVVLMARSPVFAAMFQHDTKEKQTGVITIPDCDPESFKEFMEFLYCGKLEELSFCSALHLYETSDKYDVQELKAFCMEHLIENFTVENLCDVVIIADKYDDVKLFSAAQEFFNENLNEICQTSEWECLMKSNYRLANKFLKKMPKMKVVK